MYLPTAKFISGIRPILTVIFIVAAAASVYSQRNFVGRVAEVIDGRTVVLELESGRVTAQIENIEIPAADDPMHAVVTQHLSRLVLEKVVEFRPNGMAFKRTFGQVYIDGVDVAQQLLRDGAVRHAPSVKFGEVSGADEIYRRNEELARTERRGIWAVADERSPAVRSIKFETGTPNPIDKWTVYLKSSSGLDEADAGQTASANIRTGRANVLRSGYQGIWTEHATNSNEFSAGYDRTLKEGFTAAAAVPAILIGPRFDQDSLVRLIYVYKGDPDRIIENTFLIGVRTHSGVSKFDVSNEASFSADGRAFRLGRAKYLSRTDADGIDELLIYELEKAAVEHLAGSRKSGIRIGNYSASFDAGIHEQARDLLSISR